MSNSYIIIPNYVLYTELAENGFRLNAKSHKKLSLKNHNVKTVSMLLYERPISGKEVGSLAYVGKSDYIFLRTKAIQNTSFILDFDSPGTFEFITPKRFRNNLGKSSERNILEGDIFFVTGGNVGEVAIAQQNYPKAIFSSHIYKLPIISDKYYIFSLLKHYFCKEQANFSPEGSIKGLDSFEINYLLNIKIPFPNANSKNTIKFIELLTISIINKEKIIKQRHQAILEEIETELKTNQKPNKFKFEFPNINEILELTRLDTGLYNEIFKYYNFLVKNYINGSVDLISRGFYWARGTSLEKNFIKTRIDSDTYYKGFYELILPTNISQYGFVEKSTYIGTPTKLKTISQGDIIFGGEGFSKGRTFVVCEAVDNIATNYHGIRIINKNRNLTESIFIRCFLSYWRSKGMIDYIGVGGSGGHCAPSYFHLIETPLFTDDKQKEIAKLYYNADLDYKTNNCTLDNFLETDSEFNKKAGIYELDKTAKKLKSKLNQAIDDIINDRKVDISF